MSYFLSLLTIASIQALAVISPGPNFVATVHYTVTHSRRGGIFVACGVATATSLWVILSITGLGIISARFSWLVEIIRISGVVYIILLGIRMIWTTQRQTFSRKSEAVSILRISAWRRGFLTNVSNPKTAVFFTSLFVLLLPVHPPLWFQIACVAIIVLISASWYILVACLFSWKPATRAYLRARKWIDLLTGGIFIVFGIYLAASKL
jgi:threonine efflux protein